MVQVRLHTCCHYYGKRLNVMVVVVMWMMTGALIVRESEKEMATRENGKEEVVIRENKKKWQIERMRSILGAQMHQTPSTNVLNTAFKKSVDLVGVRKANQVSVNSHSFGLFGFFHFWSIIPILWPRLLWLQIEAREVWILCRRKGVFILGALMHPIPSMNVFVVVRFWLSSRSRHLRASLLCQ